MVDFLALFKRWVHDDGAETQLLVAYVALPPTRKRLQDADAQRRQAILLERVQRTLQRLAEMHELGTITPELAPLTSKAAVESALFNQPSESAIHAIFKAADRAETNAEQALRLAQEALVMGIPGYFPTPPDVAEGLLQFAGFDNIEAVLEPSAGAGALIDAVLTHHPEARVSYCEINVFLLDVLRLKYGDSKSVRFLERDCGELESPVRTVVFRLNVLLHRGCGHPAALCGPRVAWDYPGNHFNDI